MYIGMFLMIPWVCYTSKFCRVAWKTKCQGDLSEFLKGCGSGREAEFQMKPKKKIPSPGIVSKHPEE